jgi:catechol 2,3-dioxygenase-like lactoylglutathione lyase family enzyme
MKRLHVHVGVDDLAQSIRFYSTLFAAPPSVEKPDYAKWMLEDPRVNFAISQRGRVGIDHLGIQVENEGELADVWDRLARAERPIVEEKAVTCCYAKGDKQWIADPQGVTWETFLTHGESTVYGTSAALTALTEPAAKTACRAAGAAPETAGAKSPSSACCG